MSASRFTWYCGMDLPGDVMAANLEAYRFEPHFHDSWSIGAIAAGRCDFVLRNASYVAREGDIVIIPPRAVHTGGSAVGTLAYGMVYVEERWFDSHAASVPGRNAGFADAVITNPPLCRRWLSALLPGRLTDGERKRLISAALLETLVKYGEPRVSERTARADPCERLESALRNGMQEPPDVGALAAKNAMHRTTLVKRFARRYGLPPSAWLRNWRVARARALLREGVSPADAAAIVGFADQAHLTRVFKRVYGTTPGAMDNAPER